MIPKYQNKANIFLVFNAEGGLGNSFVKLT